MTDAIQLLVTGVSQGSIYALVAVGFVAIFSVSGVINVAQGDFAAIGALLTSTLVLSGIPLIPAALVALLAVGVGAAGLHWVAIRPVRHLTPLVSILLTLGISVSLEASAVVIWGSEQRYLPPLVEGTTYVSIADGRDVAIEHQRVVAVVVAVVVVGAVAWFYGRTRLGRSMRACEEQPIAARLVGVSPARMATVGFAIAGTTAVVAGVLLSPLASTEWDSGLLLGLKGFVAATLAGLVSVRGALAGGIVLGVVEQFTAFYIGTGYAEAAAFVVLMAVLIIRPAGLVRETGAVRV